VKYRHRPSVGRYRILPWYNFLTVPVTWTVPQVPQFYHIVIAHGNQVMQFTPFEPVHWKTTALGCFVRPMNMTQNAPMITSVLAADTLSTVLFAYLIYLLICNQQLHHHTTKYTSFFTVCITAQIVGTTHHHPDHVDMSDNMW